MKSSELRNLYLKFFKDRGHRLVPSASLIPFGDPTLLFTSAGMVQFKPYFTGQSIPPSPRAVSCQKCFRTNDIESVGDPTHCTFFEMLGNFSFGEYFKKEAINWAWDFVINYLHIPKERLWVSVFREDDTAYDLWLKEGVKAERIVRLDEKDNFWGPAGTSGPCGPCSEIYYDYGVQYGCGKPDCKPGCDCKRYTEIWNLVFTEFNQAEDGTRTKLPRPNIDTGMGLERTAAILQGKPSMYETDLFDTILEKIGELAERQYGANPTSDHAMRVLAEHGRGVAFLIADGVMPGKEGRGYVLRRILRRAEYFAETLAHEKPFLVTVAEEVIRKMGSIYPELPANQHHILNVITSEVDNFRKALPIGRGILLHTLIALRNELSRDFRKFDKEINALLSRQNYLEIRDYTRTAIDTFLIGPGWHHTLIIAGKDITRAITQKTEDHLDSMKAKLKDFNRFSGPNAFTNWKEDLYKIYKKLEKEIADVAHTVTGYEAFILHDTYGFPIDLTKEIAASHGMKVDLEAFEAEMEKQRERAKAAQKFAVAGGATAFEGELDVPVTEFVGYEHSIVESQILTIIVDGESVGVVHEGQEAGIVLKSTPFYGEMGGQVGDTGELAGSSSRFAVSDTIRIRDGEVILHRGKVTKGSLAVDDSVRAEIDIARRLDIARNHTATHLLQYALRQVLGKQVQQRGSLVTPERLRFDFSQLVALSPEQVQQVQRIVNERVREDLEVWGEVISYPKAIADGAIALFDEKYGETVRTLRVGRPPVSIELCGGTHIHATGQIGLFIIVSESSIGSGLRRIEASTGRGAEVYAEKIISQQKEIAKAIGASQDDVLEKLKSTIEDFEKEKKLRQATEREFAHTVAESLLTQVEQIKGINIVAARVPSLPPQALREITDVLREKLKSAVIVIGTVYEDRPSFLAVVTQDLVGKGYNAGNIVRQVAQVTGGGGGGRPNMAQAGGKDKSRIDEAMKLVRSLI